jgi:mitochondrial fission protein ELM1
MGWLGFRAILRPPAKRIEKKLSALRSGNFGRAAPSPEVAGGALIGHSAWLITDGKVGMDVQVLGVAEELGVEIALKRVAPRRPWSLLAPWGPPDPRDRVGRPGGRFTAPWPDIALATGRQSIPYIRAIRRLAGPATFTVVIQNPRTGARTADLMAVPEHDGLSGDNVVVTLTAPHSFTPKRLEGLRRSPPREVAALPRPRVAVMLGGPNAAYQFGAASVARLKVALGSLKRLGASFLVTASRRTPAALMDAVQQATEGAPRIVWDGSNDNPYVFFLAHADVLIVTADSVNMTGEACATSRPVYVFEPEGGSVKFTRFHDALRRYGATRPLPATFDRLESWRYAPLDSAAQIAREIERRWLARSAGTGLSRE